jgi:membrane protease YdiL (CAAX protease family)
LGDRFFASDLPSSLAAIFNVAWRLLHLPPQMQHGVLNPVLMLLSGIILVACILTASALTFHFFEDRCLATMGIPLSRSSLQQVLIGLSVGSIPPALFFLAVRSLGDVRISSTSLDFHHILTQTLPALGSMLLLAFNEELLFRGYLLQLIA